MSTNHGESAPLAYENPQFLNSPDGRILRIMSEYTEPLARFRREQKLQGELTDTRRQLAERKLIERAKGVLMARNRMTEDQAYQKLRSMAMNKKLRLAEEKDGRVNLTELGRTRMVQSQERVFEAIVRAAHHDADLRLV